MGNCNEYVGNRGGIGFIEAIQSNAGSTTTNAVYSFPSHSFGRGCKGIVVVNFLSASAATVTGITISSNGSTRPLVDGVGNPITTITAGLHILAFDKPNNTLTFIV